MRRKSIPTLAFVTVRPFMIQLIYGFRFDHHARLMVLAMLSSIVLAIFPQFAAAQAGWTTLFEDTFETGGADEWRFEAGWMVEFDDRTYVLSGEEHHTADLSIGRNWTDYSFETDIKLIAGTAHINFRISDNGRYYVGFRPAGLYLKKEAPWGTFSDLAEDTTSYGLETWYTVEVVSLENNIKVYVDEALVLDYTDPDPLLHGRISYETLDSSHAHFDNVIITGEAPPEPLPDLVWEKMGGPPGGLGYDVRIHPTDKSIMFVTDNPSGVNKSYNNGAEWTQRNTGITSRTGPSLDGIPVFSLTIDTRSPNIIWAGAQEDKGIYKSTDWGESWAKKVNGISEGKEISFRNFGVHPNNSNIVFAGAEIEVGVQGIEFSKVKGKIYRTANGGDTWDAVWECDSLVRFILFDPDNPDIMYASTGIFDREAFNDTGVGVLKSTNGGYFWTPINNGIPSIDGNFFVGFLEMHPSNPQILFAASGNNAKGYGGVFRTENGGANWTQVLSGDIYTIVTISPSDPDVVYAGSASAFYRSENGGDDWVKLFKPTENNWGPPGIRAGVPISAVVDPDDPYIIFANNYGGGNFKSTDGAETWVDASRGYTGAHLHGIAIDAGNPDIVYTIGRSGPFRSHNGGIEWSGISYSPAVQPEWSAVASDPTNSQNILISDEFSGKIYKSADGGNSWQQVFKHPLAGEGGVGTRHGFKQIVYASPPNQNIVYAGMSKGRRTLEGNLPPQASYGAYKSINGGTSWSAINTGLPTALLNILSIAIHPTDPNTLYIGTWKDGVYKTINGGLNWVAKNNGLTSTDVRSLAIDLANPSIIYAGLGEGAGVAKTTNGGDLWGTVNTGLKIECPSYLAPIGRVPVGISMEPPPRRLFGSEYTSIPWTTIRSIVIDPTDTQTVYAADHSSGVYLSTTGGSNWAPINENLSTKAVNAMAISANGKTLYAATRGEGIFQLQVAPQEITQIHLQFPENLSTQTSLPTFTWAPDGGVDNRFVVDLHVPGLVPLWTTPVISTSSWEMPVQIWNFIPSGARVYWRIRGADLGQIPLTIIVSDEVWSFIKQ